MADIIKKISAFDELPVNGITGEELFIIAKNNMNYALSMETLYNALDKYVTCGKSGLGKWVIDNFASIQGVNNVLNNFVTIDALNETQNGLIEKISQEYVSKEDANDFALKYDVYTKDEVQDLLDGIVNAQNEQLQNMSTTINNLVDSINNSPFGRLTFEGDGNKVLCDDGEYHAINQCELLEEGTLILTNELTTDGENCCEVTEDNILKVSFMIPPLPYKSSINFDIHIIPGMFTQPAIKSLNVRGEFNNLNKSWPTPRRTINITFDNEIYSYIDKYGYTNNYVKAQTYLDEDRIYDKINIYKMAIDSPHRCKIEIECQLTDKLPIVERSDSTISWRVFTFK